MNQVLEQNDKKGGHPIFSTSTKLLWDVIDTGGLIDMVFLGPRFMWLNNRGGNAKIRERLDHAVCN